MESKRCISISKLKNGIHELMMIRDDDTGMDVDLRRERVQTWSYIVLRVSEWW